MILDTIKPLKPLGRAIWHHLEALMLTDVEPSAFLALLTAPLMTNLAMDAAFMQTFNS